MATIAQRGPIVRPDDRLFLGGSIVMVLIIVAGFSLQLAAGRSSFASPLYVHVHALTFFGWVAIYSTQLLLATTGSIALHKRLGWVAAAWIPLMVVVGTVVAVEALRAARAAPIFTPAYFLIMAPLTVYCFAVLATGAIVQRRETEWHKRLHFLAMASLMGPGFGRLLPMPLLIPYTSLVETVLVLLIPVGTIGIDARRTGHVHPAWWWGLGTIVASRVLIETLAASPLAVALYALVTAGSPGAGLAPLAYPRIPG